MVVCLFVACGGRIAYAQGDDGIETKFIASLTNAALKGTWAPVQQGGLGNDRGEHSNQITRVEKSN